MLPKKTIFAIIGSASIKSANEHLVTFLAEHSAKDFSWTIFNELRALPAFSPEESINNPPQEIIAFRAAIDKADAVLISTPEYIFSIPAGLKNALEWCVATNVFLEKKVGIITASANGQKGHEALQLILKTLGAYLREDCRLLIPGIKGKINSEGQVVNETTCVALERFLEKFSKNRLE